ncbi:hypothetical protein DL95DRAFT_397672, partial [Leptodontidium sp. 2 PMI_412]
MKAFRDRWQFELKIVRHITPILVRLRQNLEGYRLCCRTRVPKSSPGMLVAIIDESRPTSTISLGLRVAFVALLLIASIAGVVLSSVFTEWWVSLLTSVYMSWVPPLLSPFPRIRIVPGLVEQKEYGRAY